MNQEEEIEKVLEMLINDETALESAKEHFELDYQNSSPFSPSLKVKADSVLNNTEADRGFVGFFNARSRRKRKRKFEKRLKRNPDSLVIISEGDSWFQYPILLKDVIDHLSEYDDYAIRSFGFGADWLSNMVEQAEFINDIRYYDAKIFLISGGGNDLLQNKRLKDMLKSGDHGDEAITYFKTETKKEIILQIQSLYSRLFSRLNRLFPELHILCHGYDYAVPQNQVWLGEPLNELDIPERVHTEIIRLLIDDFYGMLESLSNDFKNIHLVDNRNTVSPTEWHDELHPRNYGFMKVANNFKEQIEKIRKTIKES